MQSNISMVNLSGGLKIVLQQNRKVSVLLKKDTISPPLIEAETAKLQDHFNTVSHSINKAVLFGIVLCGDINVQQNVPVVPPIFQLGTCHPHRFDSKLSFIWAAHRAMCALKSLLFLIHGVLC